MSGVNSKGFSNMTVTNTAKVLATACSPVMPAGAKGAFITVMTDGVCFRLNGTPVFAAGSCSVLNVGDDLAFDSWTYPGNNWGSVLRSIQFIRVSNDAKIVIEWF